jgi:hypothetical protein
MNTTTAESPLQKPDLRLSLMIQVSNVFDSEFLQYMTLEQKLGGQGDLLNDNEPLAKVKRLLISWLDYWSEPSPIPIRW